jgi:hypothetical protein
MAEQPAAPICRYCRHPIHGGFVRCPTCGSVYHLQCARSLGCICIEGDRLDCAQVWTRPPGGRGQTEREGWVTPPPSPPPPPPQPVAIPALRVAREAAALSLASLPWLIWASLMDRFGAWSWEAILWELFSVVLFLWTLRQEFTSLTREFGKAGVFMLLLLSMLYLLAHPPFLKIASFISHTALSVMIYRRAKT